jgi:hypothetical protein
MGPVSHRKKRSLTRIAAWIVLAVGIVAFAGAATQFVYLAYESGDCYEADTTDHFTGEPIRRAPIHTDECRLVISRSEDHQRIDAAIAILAIVVMSGAAVRLSKASRRTKRVVLMVEVAVVAVGIVYTILLASVLR